MSEESNKEEFKLRGIRNYFYKHKDKGCGTLEFFETNFEDEVKSIMERYEYSQEVASEIMNIIYAERINEHEHDVEHCLLMSGMRFIEDVKNECIMGCDGVMGTIYVDGYATNLGIASDGINHGEFLVDLETLRDMCEASIVYVSWANK